MSSMKEGKSGNSGVGPPISGAKVIMVAKKLHSDSGEDKIHSEFLKALDVTGLLWLTPQ